MKFVLGSLVFLASLFLMRQVLVTSGVVHPNLVMLFLVAAACIPLGGIVLVEGAMEHEVKDLRERIDALEARIRSGRDESDPPS